MKSSVTKAFAVAVTAAALGGCVTTGGGISGPVNDTRYEPANPGATTKITRCEDNGILVVDGRSASNVREFERSNWGWIRQGGVTKETFYTAQGPMLLYYNSAVQQRSGQGADAASIIIGGAAGHNVGQGRGKDAATVLGAVLGKEILAPIINNGINQITKPYKAVQLREISACKQDLAAIYGEASRYNAPNVQFMEPSRAYRQAVPAPTQRWNRGW